MHFKENNKLTPCGRACRALLCFCFCLTLLLSSCVLGPDYHRPHAYIPPNFKEDHGKAFVHTKNKDWKIATPLENLKRDKWWRIFHDKHLDALENELNCNNQTIANAYENYSQARSLVNQARAGFFPTLSSIFNYVRQQSGGGATFISTTTASGTTTGTATTGIIGRGHVPIKTSYSEVLDANWEPDIWGTVHRTVESNEALAQSSQALLASTRLSLQGSLAEYYFELSTLDRDQLLLDETVQAYKTLLKLTKNQYRSGVASREYIIAAQGQLELAQAQAINNGVLRSQYEHAIAVLIGRPPANFSMPKRPLATIPPVIPITIPSFWLERRPDIAQAERLMQQANAQIGITIAAFYPTLNISGTGSAGGVTLPQLLQAPVIGWALGTQIAAIIFDGGLRDAMVKGATAAYLAQVATYRQTVLRAFQDVENNMSNLRILKQQGIAQDQAAQSARFALKLVKNQYHQGTVDYATVISSKIQALSLEKNAYDVVGLQMTSAAALVKSLGGGWRLEDISPLRSQYEGR